MKKNKYIIFASIWFLFLTFNAKSQYSIADIQEVIYVDIIPDTLLNPQPYPGTEEYYYIDINQDGFNDLKIDAKTMITSGVTYEAIFVSSLDTNTSFSLGSIDSTYIATSVCGNNFWITVPILKIYNNGDTIKNADYVSSGYLVYKNAQGSCWSVQSSEWIDSNDHYIGIKYRNTTGISYGWVRVNITNYYTVLIKDFSLASSLNGISQYKNINANIKNFPNPANSVMQVTVSNEQIQEIKLVDILGKELLQTKQSNIDVSNLSNGVYFLQVKTSDGIASKKIIIQH